VFEDRQVGFGPVCTSVVGGSSLLPLGSACCGSSSLLVAQIWLEVPRFGWLVVGLMLACQRL
jgi:hypothetical protein